MHSGGWLAPSLLEQRLRACCSHCHPAPLDYGASLEEAVAALDGARSPALRARYGVRLRVEESAFAWEPGLALLVSFSLA